MSELAASSFGQMIRAERNDCSRGNRDLQRTLHRCTRTELRAEGILAEALYLQKRADEAAPILLNVLRKETSYLVTTADRLLTFSTGWR